MAYDFKQEQRQGLKLSQQLIMTPQLQLAIRLLQLSRQDLLDTVREELQSNPVLEDSVASDTADVPEPEPPSQELDWQSYLEDYDNYKPPVRSVVDRQEDSLVERVSPSGGSLKEYLMWQLNNSALSEYEKKIGEFIIGNIDEDGCLRVIERVSVADEDSVYEDAVLDDIARLTGAARLEVQSVLEVIQQFDPPGVGARDVSECLLLQARRLGVRDTVVEEIISKHLERLADKNYKVIAREMDLPLDKVYEAVKIITGNLNPVPGAGFGLDESRVIVPDVYIQKVGGEYVFSLNEDGMPKLKVSRYYRKMLKENGASSEAGGYIQERLRSALWFIKSVHQRQKTLLRVVGSIVGFQEKFLDKGLKYMKPLVLKDVAEDVGVHESTVSRVTSNKYAQTPRGVFELKYFFSSGMNGSDGSTITSEYIKERVKSIIESEDLKKPFSDQKIADKLKEFGIAVARRTATKYREEIGYLSSSRRKTHF
jgi:RNA polymerase sigma-54 factor